MCSLYIEYIFTICSLDIHYMFTICSLYIHYMFTIYSLYVHRDNFFSTYELLRHIALCCAAFVWYIIKHLFHENLCSITF